MSPVRITSFRNGEQFSEHSVAIVQGERSFEISEIRNIYQQPDDLITCVFELHPRNYALVDLSIRRGGEHSRIRVTVDEGAGTLDIEYNGTASYRIQHTGDSPIVLDGPSPLFDWANAIMMLGICDGEARSVPVYAVDVRNGALVDSIYTYRRTDTLITVRKGIDILDDSEIVLHPDFSVHLYYANGLRYEFGDEGREQDEA